MFTEKKHKNFANGCVYALETADGYPIEVTDTFLPFYTKDAKCMDMCEFLDIDLTLSMISSYGSSEIIHLGYPKRIFISNASVQIDLKGGRNNGKD